MDVIQKAKHLLTGGDPMQSAILEVKCTVAFGSWQDRLSSLKACEQAISRATVAEKKDELRTLLTKHKSLTQSVTFYWNEIIKDEPYKTLRNLWLELESPDDLETLLGAQ